MSKIIIMNFLFTVLLWSCQETKKYTMDMPDTKPALLEIENGLNPALKNEKVIFEKYVKTRMGNVEANRLYANGDMYKIYLSRNKSVEKDASSISWQEIGAISQNGLDEIEKISKNSVIDYLNDGPHKVVSQAVSNTKWYFYFENPLFVESQPGEWRSPKFVRQMDSAMKEYLTYKHK